MTGQHQNTDIAFTTGPSTLGTVLVATSPKGVVAILLGDDPDALAHDLHTRFPKSRLTRGGCAALLAQVTALIEAPRAGWTLPLDLRGTPFQRRVWHALRGIPAGTTATYACIASRIGAPRAVRAVAGACAANAVAVAIPCHRVIRQDGTLSGYHWGADRKRALLAREARA